MSRDAGGCCTIIIGQPSHSRTIRSCLISQAVILGRHRDDKERLPSATPYVAPKTFKHVQ